MVLTDEQRLLVEQKHNLIYAILNTYKLEEAEFYDVMAIGLCKASCTYDPAKGVKFSTYAWKVMHNEYIMQLRKENRVPNMASIEESLVDDDGLTLEDFVPDPENPIKQLEDREFLMYLAKQVSPTMVRAVELRLQDVPYREISEQLGVASSYCGKMSTKLRRFL